MPAGHAQGVGDEPGAHVVGHRVAQPAAQAPAALPQLRVSFRGTWHRSADEPFIDPALFDRVQAILDERDEDHGRRFTTRRPPYLLTGLVRCAKCQRDFVGAAGTGKRHRYRYYLCWTRSRYGPTACDAGRLRGDELEEAVLAALVDVYAKPEVIQEAIASLTNDGAQAAARAEQEVARLDAELRRTEAAIERYMLAFENGKLSEDMFAARVEAPPSTPSVDPLRPSHPTTSARWSHKPSCTNSSSRTASASSPPSARSATFPTRTTGPTRRPAPRRVFVQCNPGQGGR